MEILSMLDLAAGRVAPGWFILLVALLLRATPAAAHPMPYTAVLLDFDRDSVAAELILPLQELQLGFEKPLLDAPEQVMPRYGPALKDYVLAHVHPTAPDGRPWSVEVSGMDVKLNELPMDLDVHLTLRPPAGAPLRKFTLNYDVIVHQVVSHKSFVFVRNDWNDARFRPTDRLPPMPEAVGLIRYLVYSVHIDRTQGSFWRGFGSVMMLGMTHIAGGMDHLLFLFVLLLPAPLRAAGNRWGGFRGMKPSFVQLLKIVTAFTIGHSLTLIIGGFGWLRLPQRPVEILIAVSILVSAIHAMRPWFPGREPWVAGGFGLVHGLAFSSSIAGFGFSPWHMAMTILGFNLGIELMQLAVVVAIVPTLILLSSSRSYAPVRITGAALAGTAALVWIGARVDLWTQDPGPKPAAAIVMPPGSARPGRS